jgi:hypothetical protein
MGFSDTVGGTSYAVPGAHFKPHCAMYVPAGRGLIALAAETLLAPAARDR